MDKKKEFIVKSYNTKELAGLYGVKPKIFRKWTAGADLKAILGARIGNYFTPEQVRKIKEYLGAPFAWLATFFLKMMIGDLGNDHSDDHQQDNRHAGR